MSTEPAANDDTLDLIQAAKLLHIGFKSMKALVDTGVVPALSCNQKHCVMLREDLLSYVREEGRKQADKRRADQLLDSVPMQVAPPSRGSKVALPNLDLYEVTKAGRR